MQDVKEILMRVLNNRKSEVIEKFKKDIIIHNLDFANAVTCNTGLVEILPYYIGTPEGVIINNLIQLQMAMYLKLDHAVKLTYIADNKYETGIMSHPFAVVKNEHDGIMAVKRFLEGYQISSIVEMQFSCISVI